VYWVPSIFLVALHSDYTYPVVLSLGVLWVLLGVWVYVRLAFLHPIGRAGLFCLLQATLYYVTAGQSLLFALTALGYELLRHRRIEMALFYAAFGALLPYIGASTVFAIHLPDAYAANLILCGKYRPGWASWALYACVPLLPLLGSLNPRSKFAASGIGSMMVRVVPGVVLLAMAVTVAICSHDKIAKRVLLLDYYARRQDWKNVLAIAGQAAMNPDYVQYQANRALYHRGLLGDAMFDFVQHPRTKNLFLAEDAAKILPLQCSDVFLELGLVNEAQHWAHEATSIKGETPWVLQRLVEVNLLKGERGVAAKYLKRLDKTLWFRGWAKDHRKFLDDPNAILADPRLARIKASMPKTNFIVPLSNLELCLTVMMDDPGNKMVFEYYMAKCLMEYDLVKFMAALPRLTSLGYTRIPRHFEEALCICLQMPELQKSIPAGTQISRETLQRFNDFNRVLTKYNQNKVAARGELQAYRNTYWFYVQYYYPTGGS
jgi:sorbitol-specific phosphotransferase system component IIC